MTGLNQNRPLAELTDTELHAIFEDTPFSLDDHTIVRLRASRTSDLGATTPNDIARILNNGYVVDAGGGDLAIQFGELEAIVDPQDNLITTIRPYKPR